MDENLRSEMNLTFTEWSTLIGAGLAVGVAVLDAGAMHAFGKDVEIALVWVGIGALLGTARTVVARVAT